LNIAVDVQSDIAGVGRYVVYLEIAIDVQGTLGSSVIDANPIVCYINVQYRSGIC
jgi:hypothetical protein